MKTCTKCKETKPISAFSKDKSRKDGRTPGCRDCRKAYDQQRYGKETAYYKLRDANRAAARYGQSHTITKEDWSAALSAFGHRCAYCGQIGKLTIDHITPLSKGGQNHLNNIVPSCDFCNKSKHNRPLSVWYRSKEFYDLKKHLAIMAHMNKDAVATG